MVNLKLIRLKIKKWLNSNINWLYLHNKLIKFNEGKENIIKIILLLLYNKKAMKIEKAISGTKI